MNNREQKTLEKLILLKGYIAEVPTATQTEWFNYAGLSRAMVRALIVNGIIRNSGTNYHPNYYWAGPNPNVSMVNKLVEYQKQYFTNRFSNEVKETRKKDVSRVVVATTNTTNKRESFLSALLSVTNEFSVNGFNVSINEDTAVISRNNESITLTEPTMLTKVFRIVSA